MLKNSASTVTDIYIPFLQSNRIKPADNYKFEELDVFSFQGC
jgi:hypothetical protein